MGLRKIKKNVAENKFIFKIEMYTYFPGTTIVQSYILRNYSPEQRKKRAEQMRKINEQKKANS